MTRKQFFSDLDKKLVQVDDSLKKEIMAYYQQEIDKQVASGKKVGETIKSLPDYKQIMKQYQKTTNSSKVKRSLLDIVTDKIILYLKEIGEILHNKKSEVILRTIIKTILAVIIIWLFRIPFLLVEGLGNLCFRMLPIDIFINIKEVWKLILRYTYIIFAVIYFAQIIKEILSVNNNIEGIKDSEVKLLLQPIVLLIKILTIIISIPLFGFLIGLIASIGVLMALLIKGVASIGIILLILVMIILVSILLAIIYRFVFTKNNC